MPGAARQQDPGQPLLQGPFGRAPAAAQRLSLDPVRDRCFRQALHRLDSGTTDPDMQNGSKFIKKGVQIAAGVPLRCDEPDDYSTFRLGMFGLDKLYDIDGTVNRLEAVLDDIV